MSWLARPLTSQRGLSEGVLTLPPPPPLFLLEKDILPSMPCSLLVDILGMKQNSHQSKSQSVGWEWGRETERDRVKPNEGRRSGSLCHRHRAAQSASLSESEVSAFRR